MTSGLPRAVGDRVVPALVCLVLIFLLGPIAAALAIHWHPQGITERLGKWLSVEVLTAFVMALMLHFIWALFTPAWVERLVERYAAKVVLGGFVLMLVGLAVMLATAA